MIRAIGVASRSRGPRITAEARVAASRERYFGLARKVISPGAASSSVATPRTEIVLQLTQGQIAGLGSVTDLTISGGRLWEAGIRHAFNDNAGWGVYIPLVSAASLSRMTEAQRAAVLGSWAQVVGWARDYAAEELAGARALNEANGITYADPSPEAVAEMRAQMLELQAQIVADSGMDADYVARVAAALAAQ